MKLLAVKPDALLRASVLVAGCAIVSALPISQIAYASDKAASQSQVMDPAGLVNDMTMALKTLNYEGTFVHVQGGHITSMHILHSSDELGELERLSSLDGEAREVIRNNALVTCIWPGTQSVVVSKSKPRDLLPKLDDSLTSSMRYEFMMGKPDRVAGVATHVVHVKPTDKHRYGYKFWIDQDTKMLLRSMLMDGPNTVVEQVMFTQIEYPDAISADRFDALPTGAQLSWLEPTRAKATSGLPKGLADQEDRVEFGKLPMGYQEVSETFTPMLDEENPLTHVMLTDGMASVSVYVEYLSKDEHKESSKGLSNMGAMNAYGMSLGQAFVTAVGEVPSETVMAIAKAVKIRQ